MQRIGRVLHVRNRNIILKADSAKRIKIGVKVFDESKKPVGKIFDIFGPLSTPYIAVKTNLQEIHNLLNRFLYTI